jgi:hypothetical protein
MNSRNELIGYFTPDKSAEIFSGDPCPESDAVFGVKKSLVATLEPTGADGARRWKFDFVLAPIV